MNANFNTIDETVLFLADNMLNMSILMKSEYGVMIYLDPVTNKYGYTYYVTDNSPTHVTLTIGNYAAWLHTHILNPKDPGAPKGERWAPHKFSKYDRKFLKSNHLAKKPFYWIAPNGTIHCEEYVNGKFRYRMLRKYHEGPNIVK